MSAFFVSDSCWKRVALALAVKSNSWEQKSFAEELVGRYPMPEARLNGQAWGRDCTEDAVERVVRRWWKANNDALDGRYPGRYPEMRGDAEPTADIVRVSRQAFRNDAELVACFKSLHALRYQCSEHVTEELKESHQMVLNDIKGLADDLAGMLATKHPAYDAAEWG